MTATIIDHPGRHKHRARVDVLNDALAPFLLLDIGAPRELALRILELCEDYNSEVRHGGPAQN